MSKPISGQPRPKLSPETLAANALLLELRRQLQQQGQAARRQPVTANSNPATNGRFQGVQQ